MNMSGKVTTPSPTFHAHLLNNWVAGFIFASTCHLSTFKTRGTYLSLGKISQYWSDKPSFTYVIVHIHSLTHPSIHSLVHFPLTWQMTSLHLQRSHPFSPFSNPDSQLKSHSSSLHPVNQKCKEIQLKIFYN